MRETCRTALVIAGLLFGSGCVSTLKVDPPAVLLAETPFELDQNPVFIPLGPESYGQVFENVLQSLHDSGFEIQESNRYDGRIETVPKVAPGIGYLTRPGSPSVYERVLASFQSYRHRVSVNIQPADNGGFFVEVIARKELEDLSQPTRMTAGAAVFRPENNVERQREVIDDTVFEPNWIYKGRDVPLEQKVIRLLKNCM